MFERMAEAEEKEQERPFGPSAKRGGTRRGDEHQRVDLESLELQILDRLAQGEPAAKAISGNIESERNPGRRVGHLLDREADPEHRPAQQRDIKLGVRAKNAAMGMYMLPFGMLGVIMATMIADLVVCVLHRRRRYCGRRFRIDAHIGQRRADPVERYVGSAELDADHPRRARLGFDDAGKLAQTITHRSGAPRVSEPLDVGPEKMLILVGQCRPGTSGELAHPFERHDVGIIVDTKLDGCVALRGNDMRLFDARPALQFAGQPF